MARIAQPKSRWRRYVGVGSYIFLLAFCLFAGAMAGWINSSALVRTVAYQWLTHKTPQEAWGGKDSVTLLVLGCDEDLYYGGKQIIHQQARSDMMLVAKLDFKNNRITGVSIPRDTLAAPHGYRREKINAFHLLGGPLLSKAAVESVLPVQIDRVVVLNYPAFQQMVDMVGGVRVDVPKKMDYDDNAGHLHIHLKPGVQNLDGVDAVGFVRFRHSDDDYHRQARQKEFLVAFKTAAMRHPTLMMKVADKAREVMGNSLTPEEMGSLALFVKSVSNENIRMGMVPTLSAGNFNLRVDKAKLPKVLRQFNLDDNRLDGAVSFNR
jgi:LCP family protein required for cell wall assembly